MLLTDQERERFAEYCRQNADSSRQLVEQLEKMPGLAALAKQQKIQQMAFSVVYTILKNTESQTLGGDKG